MGAEPAVPKGPIQPVHFGFAPGGEGFGLLRNGQGWQGRELQDAKRLAGLPAEAADAETELIRFWGGFHGQAVAVRYEPIHRSGHRKGSFDVSIMAASSSSAPPDPEMLLAGKEVTLERRDWIAKFAKEPPERRRPWLFAVFKALFGLRGEASLQSWSAFHQFSAAVSLFPWPLVRGIDMASSPWIEQMDEATGQFVVGETVDRDEPPPWAPRLLDRIERGIVEQPQVYADALARIDQVPEFHGLKRFYDALGVWLEPPAQAPALIEMVREFLADSDLPEDFRFMLAAKAVAGWVRRDGVSLIPNLQFMVREWRSANPGLADQVFRSLAAEFAAMPSPAWDTWSILDALHQSDLASMPGEGSLDLRRWLCSCADRKPEVDAHDLLEWVRLLEDVAGQGRDLEQVGLKVLGRLWSEFQGAGFWERRSLLRLRKRLRKLRGLDFGMPDLRAAMYVDEKALSIAFRMVRSINRQEAPFVAVQAVLDHGGAHRETLLETLWAALGLGGHRLNRTFLSLLRARFGAEGERNRLVFSTLWAHIVQIRGDARSERDARLAWASMQQPTSLRELEQKIPVPLRERGGVWRRLRWVVLVVTWCGLGLVLWWRLRPESFHASLSVLADVGRQAWSWLEQVFSLSRN